MNENRFRELVRLAIEAEHLDDPAADDPRTPFCLSMPRLDSISMAAAHATPAEQEHLASCELCSGRLRALRSLSQPPIDMQTYGLRQSTRRWTIGLSAAALAAVIALFIVPRSAWSPGEDFGFRMQGMPRVTRSEGQSEHEFLLSTERPCWIFVIYRTWDAGLGKLDWKPHIWTDGKARTELRGGETVRLSIDVTGDPLVEQALVMAASRNSEKLPATKVEADDVAQCLRHQIVPAISDGQAPNYREAMKKCLAGVSFVDVHRFQTGGG